MAFNSIEYVVFYIIVLTVSWAVIGFSQFRTWFILISSIYFYYSNNHWQIILLLTVSTIDYYACLLMCRTQNPLSRKLLVSLSVITNIGMLSYFKYFNFFGNSFSAGASFLGIKVDWIDTNIALPVGISFYTFEALSYTIDVYRNKIVAERKWPRVLFLVSFFPHLISGPIVRASDFFPQMDKKPIIKLVDFEAGLFLIFIGMIKKFIFGDSLSYFADVAFGNPSNVSSFDICLGIYAFAFQIYFDFSGYTDIALGCAKLLGYQLPENFNRPYAASSITDFWRRWHMSLSTWLRDYLYISLGGNRMKTRLGVYRNLMLTMILGGLWHGASWHFVLWGFLHGVLLSVEKMLGLRISSPSKGGLLWRQLFTFHLVVLCWIPFRAPDLDTIRQMMIKILSCSIPDFITAGQLMGIILMAGALAWQILDNRFSIKHMWINLPLTLKASAYGLAIVGITISVSETPTPFIYFRF